MNKIKIVTVGLILPLLGCGGGAAGRWTPYPLLKIGPNSITVIIQSVTNYKLGEVKTVFVGQPIVQVREICHKTISATGAIPIHSLIFKTIWSEFTISFKGGDEYLTGGTLESDAEVLVIIPSWDTERRKWGVLVSRDGVLRRDCLYSYDWEMMFYPNKGLQVPTDYKFEVLNTDEEYLGMSYELIFTGKNDISLNAIYREYTSDGMARPAFFQNLTYQPDSTQLRFKDFVIKVYDVSNEKITYTVIEDGLK